MIDWGIAMENINWWAVLAGAAVPFVLGFLWYSPKVFAKTWAKEAGVKQKDMQDTSAMPKMFGTSFLLTLLSSYVLALLMFGTEGFFDGLGFGAAVGVAFSATVLGTHYLYSRRSLTLFLIDAGYSVGALALMGAVHGLIN